MRKHVTVSTIAIAATAVVLSACCYVSGVPSRTSDLMLPTSLAISQACGPCEQTKQALCSTLTSSCGCMNDSHTKLPDDPKAEWSTALISSVVGKHLRAQTFNLVLTFDGSGVSGHANHVAIYTAIRHLISTGEVPKECTFLSLVTVGLLRKYFSFLELPLSWLLPSHLCLLVGSKGYKRAKAAMLCHGSQLLWFRRLYIAFSRYMFVNTFQVIPRGPKIAKIY
ncbi:N-acetylglucosaminyl-phosphatidylinositol de-N-acetylase [Oryzias melastigma]|uniref:N-acetylglucosaminylphosphatidylinositol deacetylase n=1 Tax=Oryzias melastigma TaxID=30732 RepID=A0A834BSB0_ORYME|nr:N-acetylglucosaminyl-phosphatidylinositol de-N-acetylase [Oryzias melastigma]